MCTLNAYSKLHIMEIPICYLDRNFKMTTRNVHIVNYNIVNFRQKLYVLLTIKPWDGHDLHENGEHDGSSGGECIQYLKHVHPSLHTEITTYQLSILHPCTSVYATGNLQLDMLLAKRVQYNDEWGTLEFDFNYHT